MTERRELPKVAQGRCDHESKDERERQGLSGIKVETKGKNDQQEGRR